MEERACSEKRSSFADIDNAPLSPGNYCDAENVFFTHDEEVVAIDLDFSAGIFAEECSRLFYFENDKLPASSRRPLPGDDLALSRFSLALSGMMMPPAMRSSSLALK